MLKNELNPVKEFVESVVMQMHDDLSSGQNEGDGFRQTALNTFHQLREAWNNAAFSTPDDQCLKRYFSFHLEGIRELLDTLHFCENGNQLKTLLKSELLTLIHYQRRYFGDYFNLNVVSPLVYADSILSNTGDTANAIKTHLEAHAVDESLKKCLFTYLDQMNTKEASRYSYHALFYFEKLVSELAVICKNVPVARLQQGIVEKLTELNFNSIDFFCYLGDTLNKSIEKVPSTKRLKILSAASKRWELFPEQIAAYDPRCPSLGVMFKQWLGEEVGTTNAALRIPESQPEKLPLNLSVAHLACLTRLFFEENLYNTQTLNTIFKFITSHFQTKRQGNMSPGGFSKEYYSITQVTAAVIRDKLLRMVSRLNREFFPALAAVAGATLLSSVTR